MREPLAPLEIRARLSSRRGGTGELPVVYLPSVDRFVQPSDTLAALKCLVGRSLQRLARFDDHYSRFDR